MKIYIASCVAGKSGVKDNRKWQMYKITGGDGRIYTSFSDYAPFVGQEVEREVVNKPWTDQQGQQRDGWTILEPKKQVSGGLTEFQHKLLVAMEHQQEQILAKLTALQSALAPGTLESAEDEPIFNEDEPF